ncbi:hypothetical protein PINS_up012027 [Pythium insidiosum]|nr:hypothetical protein PINS_up012027 [Pythium insidiosum]
MCRRVSPSSGWLPRRRRIPWKRRWSQEQQAAVADGVRWERLLSRSDSSVSSGAELLCDRASRAVQLIALTVSFCRLSGSTDRLCLLITRLLSETLRHRWGGLSTKPVEEAG